MRSLVMVIRSAYFGAQKRRKYAKCVGVNRSVTGLKSNHNHFLYCLPRHVSGNGANLELMKEQDRFSTRFDYFFRLFHYILHSYVALEGKIKSLLKGKI